MAMLIGLVVGALFGGAIGQLPGAVVGGFLGWLIGLIVGAKRAKTAREKGDDRVAQLEAAVAVLQSRVTRLEQGGAMSTPEPQPTVVAAAPSQPSRVEIPQAEPAPEPVIAQVPPPQ